MDGSGRLDLKVIAAPAPSRPDSILGIDPGVHGALALYTPATGALLLEDMPIFAVKNSRGMGRNVIDHYGVARIIDDWSPRISRAWIERAATRPDESNFSALSIGTGFGVLVGVCAAHFIALELVTPQVWKRGVGVKGDKAVSRQRASALMPRHCGFWRRVKDDGRAEASLIAFHGARQAERLAA